MSYATQQNLIDKFGEREILQLSDRAGTGAIDSGVVAAALAAADAQVDSYIGKRHRLPLAETPPRITDVAADIAYFKLFRNDPPEYVRTAYEDAMKFLRDVSRGEAVIEYGVGGEEPAPAGDVVLTSGPERTFSRDKLEGF